MKIPRDEISLQKNHLGHFHKQNRFLFIFNLENYHSTRFLLLFTVELGYHIILFFNIASLIMQFIHVNFFLNLENLFFWHIWILKILLVLGSYVFFFKAIYFFDLGNKLEANFSKICSHILFLVDLAICITNIYLKTHPNTTNTKIQVAFEYYFNKNKFEEDLTIYCLINLGYILLSLYFNWIVYSAIILIEKERFEDLTGEDDLTEVSRLSSYVESYKNYDNAEENKENK